MNQWRRVQSPYDTLTLRDLHAPHAPHAPRGGDPLTRLRRCLVLRTIVLAGGSPGLRHFAEYGPTVPPLWGFGGGALGPAGAWDFAGGVRLLIDRPRGRVERQQFSKSFEAGSSPAGDTSIRQHCLVMRLASQSHCLWDETGPIPVRGAAWVADSW